MHFSLKRQGIHRGLMEALMVTYARRTMSEALARAKHLDGHRNEVGMCLAEVAEIYGLTGPYRWGGNGRMWAINFWLAAVEHGEVVKTSDPRKIPAGAMVFHAPRPKAKSVGGMAGHVAIGAGSGKEYSTDQPHDGRRGKVSIRSVEKAWTKKLLGYIVVTGDGITLTDRPGSISTDKMDPAAYFLDARGPHVTWLGERLVLHLAALGVPSPYALGPGPHFTEVDRAAVMLFQEAQGWIGDNADGFPGPTTLLRLARAPGPTPIRALAMVATTDHFMVPQRGLSMNCAGYDHAGHGAATAERRARRIGAKILALKPNVICLQELEIHSLNDMDKALRPGGYRRMSRGGKGREIYLGKGCSQIASGLERVSTELDDDDKPWAWTAYTYKGTRCMAVSFHNENQGHSVQRQQLAEVLHRALALANKHKVPWSNLFVTGDGNLLTAEDVVEEFNWMSAGKHAPKRTNYGLMTATKWGPKRRGKPIDVDLFRHNATVDAYSQLVSNTLSDHYLHYVDFRTVGR